MQKCLLIILMSTALTSCSVDLEKATRLLTAEGITNIKLTGYSWFGCGKEDEYNTGFTGIKNNIEISGYVCCGIVKGCTIRYE